MKNDDQQKCIRCQDKTPIAKNMCSRCYYATKRGHLTYFEMKVKMNYVKDGVGFLETKKGEKFFVDLEDFDECGKYIWSSSGNGYAKNNKVGFLHRFICPQYKRVDHINQNTLDNRKSNLREGIYINVLNTDKRKQPCPIYKTKQGLWYGQTTVEGKRIYINASKDRDDIVSRLSEILSSVGRLSFYQLNQGI